MNAARATARWIHRRLQARRVAGKVEQAEADFLTACVRLEIYDRVCQGTQPDVVMRDLDGIADHYAGISLSKKIQAANDMMTNQVVDLFRSIEKLDTGDIPLVQALAPPAVAELEDTSAAADAEAVEDGLAATGADNIMRVKGSPAATLPAAVSSASAPSVAERAVQANELTATMRDMLTAAAGHSLWLGPSQFPTPDEPEGVYLKGYVPPGTVVAMYPGKVYNAEMLLRASDAGHLANPDAPTNFIPRFDDTLINTGEADAVPSNPFALAHHVRHPPVDIEPNVIRIQFDAMEEGGPLDMVPIPPDLMRYMPTSWGASISLAKSFVNMVEQGIGMKTSVLIANRELLDEELFVDHQLNPFGPRPEWYTARNEEADRRLWEGLTSRG